MLRMLRLIKLARIVRSSRLIKRLEDAVEISYAKMNLLKSAFILLGASHLMACAFGFVGRMVQEDHGSSWLDSVHAKGSEFVGEGEIFKHYAMALYWAIMTITSVGYGDISPQWVEEYIVVILCMLIGGSIWAYNIGNLCSVVSNLSQDELSFQQQMDELTAMAHTRHLPKELRQRLRSYLWQSRSLRQMDAHREITQMLSPALQGEVFCNVSRVWLMGVSFFKQTTTPFVMALTKSVSSALF